MRVYRHLVWVWAILFAVRHVGAQPVFTTYHSLDLRVAQAQSIVRGSISNLTRTVLVPPNGYRTNFNLIDGKLKPYATQLSDGVVVYTISVKVDEILKGKPPKLIELVEETSAYDKRFEQWAGQRTSFLWFIGDPAWSNLAGRGSSSNSPYCSTIRLGEPVPGERAYSSDPPVFAMDFTPLTDPKEILVRTRKLAKQRSDSTNVHTFKSIPQKPLVNPWASLAVPVNASLEKFARQIIAAPEKFIDVENPPVTRAWMRCQWRSDGVNALSHFKSARNIRVLKSLLNDQDSYLAGPEYATTRQYAVRSRAYEILKSWGVHVQKPVVEETVSANERR